VPTAPPTEGPKFVDPALPAITLDEGQSTFSIGGTPSFLFMRNPTGKAQADFDTVLGWAASGGSRLIRVHLTQGWWGTPWITGTGQIKEEWFSHWDRLFDAAQAQGIYVIPVFGVWADWNNGIPDYGGDLWQYNPLNIKNGGAVSDPATYFDADAEAQTLWLAWMMQLVERWQGRSNIAAWEVFSEFNIASGATPEAAAALLERAAAAIHAADPEDRPITASLAGVYAENSAWAELYHHDEIDFIEIHPYIPTLDREIIANVGGKLTRYQKPVMIAESGLDAYSTAATRPGDEAIPAIEHAIWAAIVSGAMNGRGLWFEDGYAVYSGERTDAFAFMESYADAELAAARFVEGIDFTDLRPLEVQFDADALIWGAAVGSNDQVIGWMRDATCEPPDWPLSSVIAGQEVIVSVPGDAAEWQVAFYSTETGTMFSGPLTVMRSGDILRIPLPDFTDSIAFIATPQSTSAVQTPTPDIAASTAAVGRPFSISLPDLLAGGW
jgi:hypothetical protein